MSLVDKYIYLPIDIKVYMYMKWITCCLNYVWSVRLILVSIIAGVFIYFRDLDYYKSIPRHNLLAAMVIVLWSYLTLKEPIFLLVGLVLLNVFGYHHDFYVVK
jgi:hypothetical protein